MSSKRDLKIRIDYLRIQLSTLEQLWYDDIDKLFKRLQALEAQPTTAPQLPQRDRYLTALLVQPYIGKRIVLKDGDTEIIGACTGINDLYVDKPIFEIDGQLREGIPVRIVE